MSHIRNCIERIPSWTFTVLALCAIVYLTIVPRPLPPMEIMKFPHVDKVVHALMFGGLVGAMLLDYTRQGGVRTIRFTLLSVVLSTCFGGVIELLQSCMSMGRSGDWYDFMADAGGAIVFAGLAPLFRTIFRHTKNEQSNDE